MISQRPPFFGLICLMRLCILGISRSIVLIDKLRAEDISIMLMVGLDLIKSIIACCLSCSFLPSFLPSFLLTGTSLSSALRCITDLRGKETVAISSSGRFSSFPIVGGGTGAKPPKRVKKGLKSYLWCSYENELFEMLKFRRTTLRAGR